MEQEDEVYGEKSLEIEGLIRFAKDRKGVNPKDILGIIKGAVEKQDEVSSLSEIWEVPLVVLEYTDKEAIYSFAQAVLMAIKARETNSGWFIVLPPIKVITEELQREWEEYKAGLAILRAA